MSHEQKRRWSTSHVVLLCLITGAASFYSATNFRTVPRPNAPLTLASELSSAPESPGFRAELEPSRQEPTYYRVVQVLNGDEFKLENGTDINLMGVSCPKLEDADETQSALAREAVAFTTGSIVGKDVRLEYEVDHPADGQGRTLAYAYLRDGTLLNAELIKRGYGGAFTRYEYKFLGDFRGYELAARAAKLGQWEERTSIDEEVVSENSGESSSEVETVASDSKLDLSAGHVNAQPLPRPRLVSPPSEAFPVTSTVSPPVQESIPTTRASDSYEVPSYVPRSSYKPSAAENGSYYGQISERTRRPKDVYVRSYVRRDGTYVRSHYRSSPRR